MAERQREKLLAQFAAANTFGDVAKEYIDKIVAGGRATATTSKANWLLEQLAPISKRPIGDLKPVNMLAALKLIEARGSTRLHGVADPLRAWCSATPRPRVVPERPDLGASWCIGDAQGDGSRRPS